MTSNSFAFFFFLFFLFLLFIIIIIIYFFDVQLAVYDNLNQIKN